ncbi:uncharacterized protein LOC106634675 [Pan paniscus]|uniref:uncharacterized protein LOC106634675 n=1 Tax=Pan paniscus TaxID=9597 RepID=UPI001560720C|nr:uncharacterized protein LOC106634675 [Pan paniscus]XP_054967244.1 uncharacterized protein LOC106634675 [Pan paniscus]XP_054967245.1 uncharacterized protein LOC106634675 [Pan paniscus]XP_054967246.1 uncharacterized protein LOC106634675 [Pan paniscus]
MPPGRLSKPGQLISPAPEDPDALAAPGLQNREWDAASNPNCPKFLSRGPGDCSKFAVAGERPRAVSWEGGGGGRGRRAGRGRTREPGLWWWWGGTGRGRSRSARPRRYLSPNNVATRGEHGDFWGFGGNRERAGGGRGPHRLGACLGTPPVGEILFASIKSFAFDSTLQLLWWADSDSANTYGGPAHHVAGHFTSIHVSQKYGKAKDNMRITCLTTSILGCRSAEDEHTHVRRISGEFSCSEQELRSREMMTLPIDQTKKYMFQSCVLLLCVSGIGGFLVSLTSRMKLRTLADRV